MEFTEKEQNGIVIITIEGEMIGGPIATVLSEKLREYMNQDKTRFIVDMSKISWMNSSGLGILMSGMTTVRNNGGKLI